jgi:hypothetical protein
MIDIQTKLFEACASIRTINTYQRFIRDVSGTPTIHPYTSGVGGGEVHVYDDGEVEVSIRNSGLIVLGIYSKELGYDHYYIVD